MTAASIVEKIKVLNAEDRRIVSMIAIALLQSQKNEEKKLRNNKEK